MARTAQNQSDLLATETRQFTDVSKMTEAYRGRADVRFIQTASGCLLSRVRDIFEASGQESIQLYELCIELGVSARTLQIAFNQAYGISPMRYLKLRRLHAVRQHLITSSVTDVSIKRAALEGGFVDRSRFAEDFRKLFGHLPSQTPRA